MPSRVEATFALGDLTLTELGAGGDETLGKLTQATNAFHEIIQESPTNAAAARAWGRIGDGCLLISRDQPGYLAHAEEAYRKSLTLATVAPAEVRSQAHLGLAYALERSVAGLDAETRWNSAASITPWLFSMDAIWRKVKKWMPIGRPKAALWRSEFWSA